MLNFYFVLVKNQLPQQTHITVKNEHDNDIPSEQCPYSKSLRSIEKTLFDIENTRGSNAAKMLEVELLNIAIQWE